MNLVRRGLCGLIPTRSLLTVGRVPSHMTNKTVEDSEMANQELIEGLQSKDTVIEHGGVFIERIVKDCIEHFKEDPESTFVKHIRSLYGCLLQRNAELIFECSESPIETMFLSGILLASICSGNGISTVFQAPMADAINDMAEYRKGIASVQSTVKERGHGELLKALDRDRDAGVISPDEWASIFGALLNYGQLDNSRALHVVPQARFPKFLDGKDIRVDVLFWCPAKPKFKVVVECDSYTYHDNHKSFDTDRKRSRALQAKGFQVLQISGGELYREPVKTVTDLHKFLLKQLPKEKAEK